MPDLSILWLSYTPPYRIALLTFVITAVLLYLIKIFPKLESNPLEFLLRFIIHTFKLSTRFFFRIIQFILILLFKIFKNKMNSINHSFEDMVIEIDMFFKRMAYRVKQIKFNLKKRQVFSIAVLLALLFLSIMIKFPDSKPGIQLAGYDKNFNKYLNLQDISSAEAQKLLALWVDDLWETVDAETNSSLEENSNLDKLQLKADFEGGNIRNEPGNGTVVTILDPPDFVYFLNNEVTMDNGDIWFEVETRQGQAGWISSNIVEFID